MIAALKLAGTRLSHVGTYVVLYARHWSLRKPGKKRLLFVVIFVLSPSQAACEATGPEKVCGGHLQVLYALFAQWYLEPSKSEGEQSI